MRTLTKRIYPNSKLHKNPYMYIEHEHVFYVAGTNIMNSQIIDHRVCSCGSDQYTEHACEDNYTCLFCALQNIIDNEYTI